MNREQLKTILWLRWRLTRNQWAKSGGLGAAISVIVGIGAVMLSMGSFAGAFLAGYFALRESSPLLVMTVWFGVTVGFLFSWMIGLLTELQRSETIDLQRLMHLPVALGQMFVVNYVASHLALSIVLLVPAMIGLALGLVFSRGPAMLLLLPLALSMVFMITAWTYCLRGWLASMMSNPRRRRSIIMGITLAFILVGQAPNLYFNVFLRNTKPVPKAATPEEAQEQREARKAANLKKRDALIATQVYLPPLWLSVGANALAEGRPWPAVFGTVGCFAIGALGLRRAYRSTLRFYHGETGGKAGMRIEPTPASSSATGVLVKAGSRFLELKFPAVPEQATALALATLRSMLRAPEVKMAWGSSFVVTLVLGASFMMRSSAKIPEAVKPFMATGAVAFSIFLLVQFFTNHFGLDRDGFRALILSPVDRRLILLGKNLACLPVGIGFGISLLVLLAVWLHLPLLAFVAALFQLATLLLVAGLAGNLLSILVPYRIQAGTLKPTKMPGLAMLTMVACHLLFPIVMLPAFLPPLAELLWGLADWPKAVPVNLLLSAGLAALMAFVYWQTLAPLGRLLQRRETKILSVVSVEVE